MIPRPRTAVFWLLIAIVPVPGDALGQGPIEPGEPLPTLGPALRQVDGTTVSPRGLGGEEGTVFLFWSNRCPWVDRYEDRVQSLAAAFAGQGIRVVRVNANDATEYPAESLEESRAESGADAPLPYVRDPKARLARALGATRTPHAFVFDDDWVLRYAGAIDDSPSLPAQVEDFFLRDAVQALVSGDEVSTAPKPPFGCTLKLPE